MIKRNAPSIPADRTRQARVLAVSLFTLLAGATPFGCSNQGNAGLAPSVGCNVSTDCPADSECSANGCVPYVACASSDTCVAGRTCVAGVCRATCSTDEQCAPMKLSCDLSAGVCQPSPSVAGGGDGSVLEPDASIAGSGAGGSGGSAGTGLNLSNAGDSPVLAAQGGGMPTGGMPSAGGSSAGSGSAGGGPGPVTHQCAGTLSGYADGSITAYTLDGITGVNCSFDILAHDPDQIAHTATGGGLDFAAINTADYAAAATCGACVEVDRDDGRSVLVTIVDQCVAAYNPECTAGHLELSKHAFDQVASSDTETNVGSTLGGTGGTGGTSGTSGKISWKYVGCPTTETVQLKVKEAGNTSWNAVLVEASKSPIKSVSIGGQPAARQDYNYWLPPGGVMGDGSVVITDVNGATIRGKANVVTGGDQDTGRQFMCQ
jgi:expansin